MIKTLPKIVKAVCSLTLAIVLAIIGRYVLNPTLLFLSNKTADLIRYFTSTSSLLLCEKIYVVFVGVYFTLCSAIYVFIVWKIKSLTVRILAQRLVRVGLQNSQSETPLLRSIRKHKNKILAYKGWIVYRFVPLGLSAEDFNKKSARLIGVFRGRIGECSFTNNKKYIEVEVLPWRAVEPVIFQFYNSTIQQKNLISMLGFASLIVGAPNGGKTYCMLTLAANYAAAGYIIVWINRKGADLDEFRKCANYYEADDAMVGWKTVFERLRRRERNEESEAEKQQKILLVFDEYQTFIARLGKDKAKFLQEFMSYIAMSRSLIFKTLIGTQSAYAEDMPKVRDFFSSTIAMGNIAKVQKSLYFETEIIEQLAPARQQGEGNIYHAANNSVEKIMVAPMTDESAIKRLIADALNRPVFLSQNDKVDT